MHEFIHHEINEEIKSISGQYAITKEARLPFNGKQILYITGYGLFDTSCCGSGGCGYAVVGGFIKDWKVKKDKDGRYISRVESIKDDDLQKKIRAVIAKIEMVQEIRFE